MVTLVPFMDFIGAIVGTAAGQRNRLCRVAHYVRAAALPAFLALALAGCASPARRAQVLARRGGMTPLVLRGGPFELRAFAAGRGPPDLLIVFIDGDGSPWVDGGRRIAADPTPRMPLALDLALETPGPVLYLGRPCYFALQQGQPVCPPDLWTFRRYSPAVVASLAAAASGYAAAHGFRRVLLVGYSGGGTLAALMARTMPDVAGLVTIAGNLDPRAWTRWHGYLPLTGSLDPALEPPPENLPQWHLLGGKDTNVPYRVVRRYFARVPSARVLRYGSFGHVCCWVRAWPPALHGILAQLRDPGPPSARHRRVLGLAPGAQAPH
jgi:pimeloyl-ACP methyl ester carboxylesterase